MKLCVDHGWIAMTADDLMKGRGKAFERRGALELGAAVMMLPAKSKPEALVELIRGRRLQIERYLRRHVAPMIFRVKANGDIECATEKPPMTLQDWYKLKNAAAAGTASSSDD